MILTQYVKTQQSKHVSNTRSRHATQLSDSIQEPSSSPPAVRCMHSDRLRTTRYRQPSQLPSSQGRLKVIWVRTSPDAILRRNK